VFSVYPGVPGFVVDSQVYIDYEGAGVIGYQVALYLSEDRAPDITS
jgi:hypothetical protein